MSQLYDTPWSPSSPTQQQLFSPDSVYSLRSPQAHRPPGALSPLPEHPFGAHYAELPYDDEGEVGGYRLAQLQEVDIGSVYRGELQSMFGDSPRVSLDQPPGRFDVDFDFSQGSTAALVPRSSRDLPPPPEDAFLVSFGPEDPRHPFNWSQAKKWTVLMVVCSAAVCVTVASSIQASTYQNLEDAFDIPRIEAVAGVSLYVLGFGVGACECTVP